MATEKNTLLIKHLPSELSDEDKIDLLKHFKAEHVRCMGIKGRMKHCVFATFSDSSAAKDGLRRLHQLDFFGNKLSVEFAKESQKRLYPSVLETDIKMCEKQDVEAQEKLDNETKLKKLENKRNVIRQINGVSEAWDLEYPTNPRLKYLYPPPTAAILTNIANALAAVPRFYVQCLHLMNKMSLPSPFGPMTATPPLAESAPPLPPESAQLYQPEPPLEVSVDKTSEEESEIESENDHQPSTLGVPVKRKLSGTAKPRKKRNVPTFQTYIPPQPAGPSIVHKPSDIFENTPQTSAPKRISINFPVSISSQERPEKDENMVFPSSSLQGANESSKTNVETCQQALEHSLDREVIKSGFGKMEPEKKDELEDAETEQEEWGATEFISSRLLRRKRLSRSEMKDYNVFKNYQSGESTSRLYIKNLAKQVNEKDLHYIFGKYVNWEDETEKIIFDIRLMKEGRMKGQAFITLPTERQASQALEETNAFMLHGKPMVVQFARSAKPKAD